MVAVVAVVYDKGDTNGRQTKQPLCKRNLCLLVNMAATKQAKQNLNKLAVAKAAQSVE